MPETDTTNPLLAPFEGENPCGESARYEPEYEQLETEIAKETSLTGGHVDWSEVVALATKILQEKSKDLLVASYYTFGKFSLDGYRGLSESLLVLNGMIQDYWEQMFPEKKRLRGRIAAMEWLHEKLENEFKESKPAPGQEEEVRASLELLQSIQSKLAELLADKAPDMSNAIASLQVVVSSFDQAKREAEKKQQQKVEAAKAASTSIELGSESDIPKATKQVSEVLKQAAALLVKTKPNDPRVYRFNRVAMWVALDQAPPVQNGNTQIGAVAPGLVTKFEDALAAGKFDEVIAELEPLVPKAPFWLDAHRMLADAMAGKGEEFEAARITVIAELAAILKQLPTLAELNFADGTPFANDKTRAWIEDEVLAGSGDGGSGGEGGDGPAWLVAYKEARTMVTKGNVSGGLKILNEGVASAGSEREAFLWKLHQAKACFDGGLFEVAIPQLEKLDDEVQARGLASWEPQLATETAELLLLCYDRLVNKRQNALLSVSARAQDVYNTLCQLNIESALKIGESKGLKKIINRMYETERR
jgi:type VI secretion system protein VasJ